MRFMHRCLAAALVLVMLCTACALAVSDSTLKISFPLDSTDGVLYAWLQTDDYAEDDLNFTAKTENGEIKVEAAASMRSVGTTWFVVLDYDSDSRWSVDAVTRTERKVLQLLAQQIIQDTDMGALVHTAREPHIDIQDAAQFRGELEKTPKDAQNTEFLGHTLKVVMEYIENNRAVLDPSNVAVVVVTSALIDDEMVYGDGADSFKTLLTKYQAIPTHVICTAAPDSNDSGRKAWRSRAVQMANYARETLGGSGSVTTSLTENDARNVVANVVNTQKATVILALNPMQLANIGTLLTITQTTAKGRIREQTWDIGDSAAYEAWLEFWKVPPGPIPTYAPVNPVTKASSSNLTFFSNNAIEQKKTETGLSTELIIGIVVGAVVLALLIVLLIVRKGAKKKPEQPAVYATPSAPKPKETVVVLQDGAGNKLTGTMKGGKLTIGRYAAKGAMLVIGNDGKLSGLHATLAKNGQGMTITDNHSTNGTKVNGVPVTGTVPLNQNDSVTMGSSTYKVTWHA